MKCKQCNRELKNDSVFCECCGTKVKMKKPSMGSIFLIVFGFVVYIGGTLENVLSKNLSLNPNLLKDEIVIDNPDGCDMAPAVEEEQVNVSLKGTKWVVPRNDDYYFTLDFISDQHVVQDGYYNEGYGAWTCQYDYSLVGQKGEIFLRHTKVAEFFVNTDKKGNPNTIVLTIYDMEPFGNEEHTVYLIEAPAEEVIAE